LPYFRAAFKAPQVGDLLIGGTSGKRFSLDSIALSFLQ
jgi:hypothetical protein